ncbi:MAG: hypothetical protein C0490_24690, partial [Marivirga sp.]|nr:hypothetical protein [Marivirga sp.]
QPGGGSATLRQQLGHLRKFMDGFDFIRMKPDRSSISGGLPAGARIHVLSEPGKQYAAYIRKGNQVVLQITLPAAAYSVQWMDPVTGSSVKRENLRHSGGNIAITSPPYNYDIALKIIGR